MEDGVPMWSDQMNALYVIDINEMSDMFTQEVTVVDVQFDEVFSTEVSGIAKALRPGLCVRNRLGLDDSMAPDVGGQVPEKLSTTDFEAVQWGARHEANYSVRSHLSDKNKDRLKENYIESDHLKVFMLTK